MKNLLYRLCNNQFCSFVFVLLAYFYMMDLLWLNYALLFIYLPFWIKECNYGYNWQKSSAAQKLLIATLCCTTCAFYSRSTKVRFRCATKYWSSILSTPTSFGGTTCWWLPSSCCSTSSATLASRFACDGPANAATRRCVKHDLVAFAFIYLSVFVSVVMNNLNKYIWSFHVICFVVLTFHLELHNVTR